MMERKVRKFIHFVMIPFTGVGIGTASRRPNWYKERIEIFKDYTLKSLLNQENRNFILWISFTYREKRHPLIAELSHYLKSVGIEYIFTFNGLMYWDDKFSGNIMDRIWNCGRVVRGCWRNNTWKDLFPSLKEILYNDKNSTLKERIGKSLDIIRPHFKDVDLVYLTRLDSDDMLHKLAIKEIQNALLPCEIFVFDEGFIYNKDTNELASYHPQTNPPFYTIVFSGDEFFDADKHLQKYKGYKSHEDIRKLFIPCYLPDYRYCVLTHNPKNQISTIWNHPFRGGVITENKKEILSDFGIRI